jgi:hypothetical protein
MTEEQANKIIKWKLKRECGGLCIVNEGTSNIYLLKDIWTHDLNSPMIIVYSALGTNKDKIELGHCCNMYQTSSEYFLLPDIYRDLDISEIKELSYKEYEHLKTKIFRKVYLKVDKSFVNAKIENLLFSNKNEIIYSYCTGRSFKNASNNTLKKVQGQGNFFGRFKNSLQNRSSRVLGKRTYMCERYIDFIGEKVTLYAFKEFSKDTTHFILYGSTGAWFLFINRNAAYRLSIPKVVEYFESIVEEWEGVKKKSTQLPF